MTAPSLQHFEVFLGRLRAELEPAIARWLEARAVPVADPSLGHIRNEVINLVTRGGKRLRPALVALAYWGIAGGTIEDALARTLGAQISMELLQAYLLIHDDWMDQDDVRRGASTAHVALGRAFGGKRFGDSAAIVAGDYASALSQRALLESDVAPDRLVAAARVFADMHEQVVLGQGMDLVAVLRSSLEDEAEFVDKIHEYKTASYTVSGPLAIGATLAGASSELLAQVTAFGRSAGIAFQYRDDLLGTFGDPTVTGKGALADLRQGKRTILTAELPSTGVSRDVYERVLLARASDEDLATVRAALEASGAKERVEARIRVLVEEAWNIARTLPFNPETRDLLCGALSSLTERAR